MTEVELNPVDLIRGVLAVHRIPDPHPLISDNCSCGTKCPTPAAAREHVATEIAYTLDLKPRPRIRMRKST